MKYPNVRKGYGYCCEMCDGPYAAYKKLAKTKKRDKTSWKRQHKKDSITKFAKETAALFFEDKKYEL